MSQGKEEEKISLLFLAKFFAISKKVSQEQNDCSHSVLAFLKNVTTNFLVSFCIGDKERAYKRAQGFLHKANQLNSEEQYYFHV